MRYDLSLGANLSYHLLRVEFHQYGTSPGDNNNNNDDRIIENKNRISKIFLVQKNGDEISRGGVCPALRRH